MGVFAPFIRNGFHAGGAFAKHIKGMKNGVVMMVSLATQFGGYTTKGEYSGCF
jgi:hypothetical protein